MNQQLDNELAALARTVRGVIIGTVWLRLIFFGTLIVLYVGFMAYVLSTI